MIFKDLIECVEFINSDEFIKFLISRNKTLKNYEDFMLKGSVTVKDLEEDGKKVHISYEYYNGIDYNRYVDSIDEETFNKIIRDINKQESILDLDILAGYKEMLAAQKEMFQPNTYSFEKNLERAIQKKHIKNLLIKILKGEIEND